MSPDPSPSIDVQVDGDAQGAPDAASVRRWVHHALPPERSHAQVSVRFVGLEEGAALNAQFRGKDGPTNVLSFPADLPAGVEMDLLGDIAVCTPVALREAAVQNKTAEAHFAHLVIHGTLHLLGFDHLSDNDAEIMEQAERDLLARFGMPDPYAQDDDRSRTVTPSDPTS